MIRFSDFIVNEVDLGGNVTHLTDLEAPPQVFLTWIGRLLLYFS